MTTTVKTKGEAFKVVQDILDKLDIGTVESELAAYGSFDLSDPMEIRRKKAVQAIFDDFKKLITRFNALNENKILLSEFVEESQFTANKVKVDMIENCFSKLLDYKIALQRFFEARPSKEGWTPVQSELRKIEIKARIMWVKDAGKIYWKW